MRRVKVRKVYARKSFFEKVLEDWKEIIDDRNFRCVVSKALLNLKHFPLEVSTLNELRSVKGFGDFLALKLESAWDNFCSLLDSDPNINDVKGIKKGEALRFLQLSSSRVADKQSSEKNAPTLFTDIRRRGTRVALPVKASSVPNSGDEFRVEKVFVNATTSKNLNDETGRNVPIFTNRNLEVANSIESGLGADVCSRRTVALQNSEVILLVDNREHLSHGRRHNICNELTKLNCNYEMRSLSVGDYVWILRLSSGTEIVLDYIVERKTLDDLSKSIRQGRYEEQKQRLLSIGLRNIVYVLEGSGLLDNAREQALTTTHIVNGFLVHRTSNAKETVQFLFSITKLLSDRTKTKNAGKLTFEAFQKNAKKKQRCCVSDLFMRQLTVCPQMSVSKAALVVNRFPTFTALAQFYQAASQEDREMLLADTIPGINRALSKQLFKFFQVV